MFGYPLLNIRFEGACSLCDRYKSRDFVALKGFHLQLTPSRIYANHPRSVQLHLFCQFCFASIRNRYSRLRKPRRRSEREEDTRFWQTKRRDDCIRMHAPHFHMPSSSILGAVGRSPVLRFVIPRSLYCTVEADTSATYPPIQRIFLEAWDRCRQHLGQTRLSFLVRQRVGRCLHRLPQWFGIRMPCNIRANHYYLRISLATVLSQAFPHTNTKWTIASVKIKVSWF